MIKNFSFLGNSRKYILKLKELDAYRNYWEIKLDCEWRCYTVEQNWYVYRLEEWQTPWRKKLQKEIVVLCGSFLLLPSIFPSIRVFSDESALCIRWPKYWSFSINLSRVFSSTTIRKHQLFNQLSLLSNSHTSTSTSFLIMHSLHLPFGTQRRSRRLNKAYILQTGSRRHRKTPRPQTPA